MKDRASRSATFTIPVSKLVGTEGAPLPVAYQALIVFTHDRLNDEGV